jgi:hypothetical protein
MSAWVDVLADCRWQVKSAGSCHTSRTAAGGERGFSAFSAKASSHEGMRKMKETSGVCRRGSA